MDRAQGPRFQLSLEGNIGSGKSTALAVIRERFASGVPSYLAVANPRIRLKLARIVTIYEEKIGRFFVELNVGQDLSAHLMRQIFVKPENMVRACDCCHLAGVATMQYCGKCRNTAYCNVECQRSDWKQHKIVCSRMNAQRQIVKSPLHLAATKGDLAEVERLVREGADVEKPLKEDGSTALMEAAEQGHLSVVQYLLRHGADKHKANDLGTTPLYVAAEYGQLAVVKYLVQLGAEKDKAVNKGGTPLITAASRGHLAIVQFLVQQGADKEWADIEGVTPLVIAGKGTLDGCAVSGAARGREGQGCRRWPYSPHCCNSKRSLDSCAVSVTAGG